MVYNINLVYDSTKVIKQFIFKSAPPVAKNALKRSHFRLGREPFKGGIAIKGGQSCLNYQKLADR